jgi:peptidylprolyl isomerase
VHIFPRALIGLVVAGTAVVAAGCSSNPADDPSASPSVTPSASSSASPTPTPTVKPTTVTDLSGIKVTGDFDTAPTLSAPYPFKAAKTMSQVLIEGTGPAVTADGPVQIQYMGVDARTGQVFDTTYDNNVPIDTTNGGFVKGFNDSLTGKKAGSRVLMVITGADGYDSGGGQPSVGIEVGDTLLFIVDIERAGFSGPMGKHLADGNQWAAVTDKAGVPTVAVKSGVAAPTTTQATVLTQGTGPAVTANDAVYVNFMTVDYATGKTIETSYGQGGSPQIDMLSNLIPGWKTGLTGVPMGSRVLLVIPGSQAYPQGNATPAITPNATLVCVVDVLFSYEPTAS